MGKLPGIYDGGLRIPVMADDSRAGPVQDLHGPAELGCDETAPIVRYGFTTDSDCGDWTQVTAPWSRL